MPDLTVTLTDAQWAAYQAVSGNPSLSDVSVWLKEFLSDDYERKLFTADQLIANDVSGTAEVVRATKLEAF